ncbi:MAG: prolyl oligopeptidase family serine peptidase [Micavibrio sp.]|nr:prolyl oligopeptidase family serine peptidase [Micavibrio sp.]
MGIGQSIRKLANKVFGKAPPANDNAAESRLKFEVTHKQQHRALDAPLDNAVVDILHGVPVSDPFRPLENLDAPETAAWAERQNKKFAEFILGSSDSIAEAKAFMTKALDYDSASLPGRYGKVFFRTFQPALAAQGVVQTATSADGPWETILDPNTLSKDGTVALSGWSPSGDGKRIVYFTSEAGSDAQTLHILDVEKREVMADKIENCRFTSVLWDKGSHNSFQYTYPTHDGTRRKMIMHHTIGQDAGADKKLFESPIPDSFVSPSRLASGKYEYIWHSIGTDKNSGLFFRPMGSAEEYKELLPPKTTTIVPITEFDDGSILALTTKDSPRGRLVRFDPRDPAPEKWQTVIPEHPTDMMDSAMLHKGKLFAFYSHDTADAVRVFTPKGEHLHDMPLPVQSTAGYARINADDEKFVMKISGFKSPGDTYTYDINTNKLDFVAKSAAPFDMNDCIVERIYATSKDGTKVPMTVIRHPDTALDGTAATKLYGYGGFNIPLGPGFSSAIMHYVKSGGIYVQANLRGGGEFGEDWYNQGRGDTKQNVFDDFAACAELLIREKYTSEKRLVINGGSNGGLLTSATMLQRPELFGAVITEVAVTDMFRFHLATYGSSWKSDYGDPDIKKDFNVAAKYSPLHNVKPNAKYPPHLIKTADHDDRVVPWHSFKLAATLQARSNPDNLTLMRIEERAGHGAGKPTAKYIEDYAETFAFIEKAIGPVNQKAYKATLAAEKKKPCKFLCHRKPK